MSLAAALAAASSWRPARRPRRPRSPPRRPGLQQHPRGRVSPDPRRPAGDLPHQGAGRPEGRVRVLRHPSGIPPTKGEDGFWTATTDPQVPGFHYYRVFIDGAEVNDPAARRSTGPARRPAGSRSRRRASTSTCPRTCRTARSGSAGTTRRRPSSGGASSSTPRPATTPTATRATRCCTSSTAAARTSAAGRTRGASAFILDNLIAERKARPMLVVMEQGYARRPGEARRRPARPPRPGGPGRRPATSAGCSARSRRSMVKDLIPHDRLDLPHDPGPRAPGDGRALDGRHADVPDRAQAPRPVRLPSAASAGRAAASAAAPFDPKTAHGGVMADADAFNKKVQPRSGWASARPSRSGCTTA